MSHKDTGWEPKGRGMKYKGEEVWGYDSGPHEVNEGQVDPEDHEHGDEE